MPRQAGNRSVPAWPGLSQRVGRGAPGRGRRSAGGLAPPAVNKALPLALISPFPPARSVR